MGQSGCFCWLLSRLALWMRRLSHPALLGTMAQQFLHPMFSSAQPVQQQKMIAWRMETRWFAFPKSKWPLRVSGPAALPFDYFVMTRYGLPVS